MSSRRSFSSKKSNTHSLKRKKDAWVDITSIDKLGILKRATDDTIEKFGETIESLDEQGIDRSSEKAQRVIAKLFDLHRFYYYVDVQIPEGMTEKEFKERKIREFIEGIRRTFRESGIRVNFDWQSSSTSPRTLIDRSGNWKRVYIFEIFL